MSLCLKPYITTKTTPARALLIAYALIHHVVTRAHELPLPSNFAQLGKLQSNSLHLWLAREVT